jgi:hypothetical protein
MRAMAERAALIFDSLRDEVLDRLVEVRASIDPAYAAIPDDRIRGQFDVVLRKMASYLADEEIAPYRGFARRWVAMRAGEGFAPESLVHAVVAIGDVAARVAQQRMGGSPEYSALASALARMTFSAARLLVELFAEELDRVVAELRDARAREERGS